MDTMEPDAEALSTPTHDLSDHRICQKCGSRYVRPTDHWKSGPQKGERHTDCGVCMGRVAKKRFPPELLVPKDVQQSGKDAPSEQQQWLLRIDAEQQSLLVHSDAVVKSFQPGTKLLDLPRAHSDVQWDAISERFRDIHCLERLFQGFGALGKKYTIEVNTIAPIGLLAVSLNNYAMRSGIPFKFAWLPIPMNLGSATLYMGFGAWPPVEKSWWAQASPHDRLKLSSAWECNIRKGSRVLAIPYATTSDFHFERDARKRMRIPSDYQECLLWHQQRVEGEEGQDDHGAFLFPDGQEYTSSFERDSSTNNAQLLNILCEKFHCTPEKVEWRYAQAEALGELQKKRASNHRWQAKVQKLIAERRSN